MERISDLLRLVSPGKLGCVGFLLVATWMASWAISGVLFLSEAALLFAAGKLGEALANAFFGVVACAMSVGVILFLLHSKSEQMQLVHRLAMNPETPWIVRKEWEAGLIRDDSIRLTIITWALAIFWNGFIAQAGFAGFREGGMPNSPLDWILTSFLIVGLVFLCNAGYYGLRLWAFGSSTFVMDQVPGVIGGNLVGSIDAGPGVSALRSVTLSLSCEWRISEFDWLNPRPKVIWSDTQEIRPERFSKDEKRTIIPVQFAIPDGCPETNLEVVQEAVAWQMIAESREPGVKFRARFEVPVYEVRQEPASLQNTTGDAI